MSPGRTVVDDIGSDERTACAQGTAVSLAQARLVEIVDVANPCLAG
jgi:hypothetical protein